MKEPSHLMPSLREAMYESFQARIRHWKMAESEFASSWTSPLLALGNEMATAMALTVKGMCRLPLQNKAIRPLFRQGPRPCGAPCARHTWHAKRIHS